MIQFTEVDSQELNIPSHYKCSYLFPDIVSCSVKVFPLVLIYFAFVKSVCFSYFLSILVGVRYFR